MATFMRSFEPQAYAMLRIVAGLLFIWHGTQKLVAFPTPPPPVPGFILYVAGPIELIGGLLVMIGLFAGWAAFLCSGLMAAAYWMVHGFQALFPIQNGGELARSIASCSCLSRHGAPASGASMRRAAQASAFRRLPRLSGGEVGGRESLGGALISEGRRTSIG